MRILILEPDEWRFRGLSSVLKESGTADVIEERDYAKVLTLESAPGDLEPHVILLAHRLIVEYGVSLIPHLKDVFGGTPVLVYGDEDSLEVTAQVFAVGSAGFFVLSSPPHYLVNAVALVSRGKLWGPREAVELMAKRMAAASERAKPHLVRPSDEFSDEEIQLLRFLHEGLSNKEMAARLGVAEVTIKARLTKLYKKFGVTSRLQLLSAAIKKGLLDKPAAAADKAS